ncbi:MAG TPA: sugar phosphate isomerase/epimerase family protein [Pseudonocardiaceae bacterium]|jgi:sugar phosphate isomerase/epimerase|nr:sugar phosphate isomerase/epimerase family protein [Pseudonocardiaceae bacterium]
MSKHLPDLIASYFTIAGDTEMEMVGGTEISPYTPRDRIEMAARAGFKGIGFGDKDLRFWLTKYSLGEIRGMLADSGIEYLEIDAVYDWYSPRDRANNDAIIDEIYGWAADLGACQVKAVTSFTGEQFPHDDLVERWARLCETAANAGTRAILEPMPPATLKTPQEGLAVLKDAGATSGGLLIDIWHVDRAGVDYESLRDLPSEWIGGVEIGDAAKELVNGDLLDDGFNHRQLPGQGELDVAGFIRAVLATGYTGPFGSEVFSIKNRARTLEQAVSDNYAAAIGALAAAVNV